MYTYFSIFSYTHSSPRFLLLHHVVTHPPSKVLPATPSSFLYVVEHIAEEIQISPPVLPHVPYESILLNVLAKTVVKSLLVGIIFLLFLYNFVSQFVLGICIFMERFLILYVKNYYKAVIVYYLNLLRKSFQ